VICVVGKRSSDYNVRLVVGIPGLDFLAESDQKTLTVVIHSLFFGKVLKEIVSTFEWLDW